MKALLLRRLCIKQFKGIKSLDLHFNGEDVSIFGANATGKTTVYDAFLWLLFGKDSQDSANFNIKPLDDKGNKLPGTEPEVTAEITFNGEPYTLRKTLREVWRKPTGQAQQVYDRDEVQASVNDVPKKIDKEYTPFISSMIPDALFKVALHHSYFMRLPWAEKRQHLIQISNPDVDGDLLADPAFAGIPAIMEGTKTTDEARKRLMDQRRRLNDELDQIPARVDELQKTVTPRSDDDLQAAMDKKAEFQKQIDEIDLILASGAEAQKKMADLFNQKSTLQQKLNKRQIALQDEATAEIRKAKKNLADLDNAHYMAAQRIKAMSSRIPQLEEVIKTEKELSEQLRNEWANEELKMFSPAGLPDTCSACGQPLPPNQVEDARQKAIDNFEKSKDAILANITARGKTAVSRAEGAQKELDQVREELSAKEKEVQQLITDMEKLRIFINSPVPEINFSDDKEFKELQEAITTVQSEIDSYGIVGNNTGLLGRKGEIQAAIAIQDKILATRDQAMASQARITELMERKSVLGQNIATIDGQLDLLAQFVSARCSRLEEHINAMFPTIRWQLFNTLKNGGIEDCCTATVNGVPYADLNSAARINAGIEAARIISRAHDITCPCFVDNAESVNDIALPAGQLIALVVSQDTSLRMEHAA